MVNAIRALMVLVPVAISVVWARTHHAPPATRRTGRVAMGALLLLQVVLVVLSHAGDNG